MRRPDERTAIQKAVAVLESLAQDDRLSDVARHADLPLSTVHRILHELTDVGWVRAGPDRTYALGARLLSLPARSTGGDALVRVCRPVLKELVNTTGHTVHFAIVDGDGLVYMDKIEGRSSYRMRSRVGMSVPMHSTAIGKAVLAQMGDCEVRGLAARTGLVRMTARTLTDVGLLVKHLERVRANGYAVDDEENETHTRCVGAAVVDEVGEAFGGLSVSALSFELGGDQVRELGAVVVTAAGRISRLLAEAGVRGR